MTGLDVARIGIQGWCVLMVAVYVGAFMSERVDRWLRVRVGWLWIAVVGFAVFILALAMCAVESL